MSVAVAAITISIASLWIAARTAGIQERLLSASVWPYLQYGTDDIPIAVQKVDLTMRNVGVGPARLQWVALYYRGRAYATARDLLHACCGGAKTGSLATITQGVRNRVLTAAETVTLVRLVRRTSDLAVWKRLDIERQQTYLRACYCSVLDECWFFDSRQPHPARVAACPPAENPLWNG